MPTEERHFARKATLLLVGALGVMSGATIAPSLPGIEAHFAEVPNAPLLTRLVLTMPALLIILSAPLVGFLADRFGRRRLLLGAVVLFGFSGVSGLVLDSIYGIIAGRAFLGMAVAGVATTATALIGDYFAGPERDRFMGFQAAFHGLAGLAFLTGGGYLAELHWRGAFAIYGLPFLLIPALLSHLPEPPRLAGSGGGGGAGATRTVPLADGVGLTITALFGAGFLTFLAMYMFPTQLPFRLQAMGITSPSQTGLAIGVGSIAMIPMALLYRRIRAWIGVMGVFVLGFGALAAALGLVGAADSYGQVMAAMVLNGLALGSLIPNLTATAVAIAPEGARGRVSGGMMASIFLGQFLSPLASQPWIGAYGLASAYQAMSAVVAAAAVATAAAAVIRRRGRVAARPVSTASDPG